MIYFPRLGHYGRLGNQLFQIASTIGIARENGRDYSFVEWDYSKFLDTPLRHSSEPIFNLSINEDNFCSYKKFVLPSGKITAKVHGYLQSEEYFKGVDSEIRRIFRLNEQYRQYILDEIPELMSQTTCTVHVRRGDYVTLKGLYIDLCETDYFKLAMAQFPDVTTFVFFSDDIKYCKANFKSDNHEFSHFSDDILDIFAMSYCPNNIISNSTFSWWGSWLNINTPQKVVCPKIWFGPHMGGIENSKKFYRKGWVLV